MIRKEIRNAIGVLIVRYVLHSDLKNNSEGWLVTRKNGTQHVIKVFSRQAYENVVRQRVHPCKNRKDNLQIKNTNADRIRSMSDEELAEFLEKIVSGNRDEIGINCGNPKCEEWKCTECISKWLQSEVEE